MRLPERVVAELARTTRFGDVRALDETDSTNRVAVDAAHAGAPEGLVVVADHQTAGRGRLGRRWEAPAGTALLVSILLRPPSELPASRYHLLSSAVGLAAADACASVAGFAPDLKWPNDLMVGDRKLAGILAETAGGAVVVGLGLNVSAAPPGAVSAEEAGGRHVERAELLAAVLFGLEARCGPWDEVAAEYAARCATVGRRVRVEVQDAPPRQGRAMAVDDDGRLLVDFGDGVPIALSAGDVFHLRPA
jgi:BirA family biotin operon repressor/biotin-[acetyl-CoA-carboxylase] ligase